MAPVGPNGGLYFEVDGKPGLVNALARGQHWARSNEVKAWRDAFYLRGKTEKQRPAWPVVIYVHDYVKGRSHDVGAVLFAVKGGIDGLVDAGLLPDDSGAYVQGLYFLQPVKAAAHSLGLELVER